MIIPPTTVKKYAVFHRNYQGLSGPLEWTLWDDTLWPTWDTANRIASTLKGDGHQVIISTVRFPRPKEEEDGQ